MNSPTRPRAVQEFWQWMLDHKSLLERLREGLPQTLNDELSEMFDKAYAGLTWEMELQPGDEIWFVISADGIRGKIDSVVQAVKDAPQVPGWTIVPFRQRGSLNAKIHMHDRTLSYDDIWCKADAVGYQANITLCIRGLTVDNKEDLTRATFILLDNAIGEFDVMVKIGAIEFQELRDNPTKTDRYFPMVELPAYLDALPDPE